MRRSVPRWARLGLAAAIVLILAGDSRAQTPAAARQVDVPFLSQSEALCGGAAAAMTLRYWGARAVQPEDFAPLLNPRRDGIETRALVDALTTRGWQAFPFTGSLTALEHHLARGRPLIALVDVGRGRFHYVVVVAVDGDDIVYHDPAIGPLRRRYRGDFERAWNASSRWTLLVLPAGGHRPTPMASADDVPSVPASCAASVARAVEAARRQRMDEAESWLEQAQAECPAAAAPLRELAGLRLLQRRPNAAAAIAHTAVELDEHDTHSWRVLGTSEFLRRDTIGALRAWNRAGEPLVDLVRVDAQPRTRHRVVTGRMGIEPGQLLTPGALIRARRRLASLPTAASVQADVVPVGSGLAEVRVGLLERPVVPVAPLALGALGVRALVTREATWQVAGLTGAGERIDLAGRWWTGRPAIAVGLSLPIDTRALHGVLRLEGGFSRETFGAANGSPLVEERRSAALALSDWTTRGLRWEAALRIDRWTDRAASPGIGGSVEQRLADDRLAVRLRGDVWPSGGFGAVSLGMRARWARDGSDRLLAAITASIAGADAPRALWQGAGTGSGRALLLRAHPLLDEGVLTGALLGRQVLHGSAEWRHPLASVGPARLQLAAFLDAASAAHGDFGPAREADAGLGLRVRIPGEGTIRLDYGRGLRDGAHAVSVGWDLPWPSWP